MRPPAILMAATLLAPAHLALARVSFNSQSTPPYVTPAVQGTQSVSVRSSYPGNPVQFNVTAGGTFRQYYEIAATGQVQNIQVCYQNISSANNNEADGPSSMAGVTSSLEVRAPIPGPFTLPGTTGLIPFTFNGGISGTPGLSVDGGNICSDKIWTTMQPGQGFYIRTFVPPGRVYQASYQGATNAQREYSNNGVFQNAMPGLTGNGVQTVFAGTIDGTISANIVLPLRAGNVQIVSGAAVSAQDDGAGGFTGTGIASGTINYATGAFNLTLAAPLANGATFAVQGLSRGDVTAPDDTRIVAPADFSTAGYLGWQTTIATVAPVAIIGAVDASAPAQHTLCLVGDSILAGIGNNVEQKTYAEYMSYSLGVLRISQGGDRASYFAQDANNFRRYKMIPPGRCSRVLVDYGSNDITNFVALADIKTALLTVWAKLATVLPNGFHDITQQYITPYTTSASVNVPVNDGLYGPGTVASGTPSVRNALNAWICTQVGVTIGATLDVNAALEAAPGSCAGAGSGTWFSLSYTLDGRHWSSAAQKTVVPAMFSPTGTNPAPVFAP